MTDHSSVLRFAVIGDPVGHSLSPCMHNAAFRTLGIRADYIAVHVLKDDLEAFARDASKRLNGFNVTVPHKKNIIHFLDEVDPDALAAESVNTVTVLPDGRLSGRSTDGYGLECAVHEAGGPALKNAVICFIGCGGVTPALAFHAASAGVAEIRILNRTEEKASILAEKLRERYPGLTCSAAALDKAGELLRGATLTVQCTSLGLKDDDPPPVDPALLNPETFLFDLVYRNTQILQAASQRGISSANGLAMLLHQGAKAFEIWTGRDAPVEVMREALVSGMKNR